MYSIYKTQVILQNIIKEYIKTQNMCLLIIISILKYKLIIKTIFKTKK